MINYYETELEGLEESAQGNCGEADYYLEEWVGMDDDDNGKEWTYEEYEYYAEYCYEDEEEMAEMEEELYELEEEQLQDDTAAAFDMYTLAENELENSEARDNRAYYDFEDAMYEVMQADDALWQAQFDYDNYTNNADYQLAVPALEAAQERFAMANEWYEAA